MDKFEYLKILQTAESDYENDKLETQFRSLLDIFSQCDDNLEEELGSELAGARVMWELRAYYVCPLVRVCRTIEKRMSEESAIGMSDWQSLPKMPPLTLEEMFRKLTEEISPDVSRRIIDVLDCTSVAKSDLMESVKANDFALFDKVIRENSIDCGLAMNVCSNICYDFDFCKTLLGKVADYGDEIAHCSDHGEFMQKLSMGYAWQMEEICDYCKCKSLSDDEISKLRDYYIFIEERMRSLLKENKVLTAAYLEVTIAIVQLLYGLQNYSNSGKLNAIEISFLKDFQRRKCSSNPCVGILLDKLFVGRFLEEEGLRMSREADENPEGLVVEYVKNVGQMKAGALTGVEAITEKAVERKNVCPSDVRLPEEIDTEKNRAMFAKAINAGLVDDKQDGHFEWKMSNASLNYFCGRLICGDYPLAENVDGKKRIVWMAGKGWLPVKVLDGLFSNGKFTYRGKQINSSQGVPKGHERVDELFK